MNKALAIMVMLALVFCAACYAEAAYDATSEEYLVIESSDPDAEAFGNDLATSSAQLYELYGVKSALYIYDDLGGMDVEAFADALVEERNAQIEDTSNDVVYVVSVQDGVFTIRAGDGIAEILNDEALTAIMDDIEAEESETIWAAVAKAYVGIGFRLMTSGVNSQFGS